MIGGECAVNRHRLLADSRHDDPVGFPPVRCDAVGTVASMDFEVMYQAMDSRDRRFDGRFFVAVETTGIYCRPICPAPTPKRKNTRFFRYAAVAELAGFRPCRRCRPEVSPDTAEWDTRADLIGRGLRLVAEGVVDDVGVAGLAERLGVSERHLQRVFNDEVGTTPGVIARSRRARLARQLLTETAMPITRVAYTAGFASVRAFNETMQQIYRITPTELRRGSPAANGSPRLELQFRPPMARDELLGFLRRRAIPGVEAVTATSYRRSIPFGENGAVLDLTPTESGVVLTVESDEIEQLAPVIQRARQLLDLDADPEVIDDRLAGSPDLRAMVANRPGLRLPGAYDAFEVAVHSVLQQGTSPAAAAALAGRLAAAFGTPLAHPSPPITHLFPTPRRLAQADLEALGLSARRAATIRALAAAVDGGTLVIDGSIDPAEAFRQLSTIPGIGAHTASLVALRALRDPDAFPYADRAVRDHLSAVVTDDRAAAVVADEWRPWRGYAVMHIWAEASPSRPGG
jgi:AraC family transcriptional regulator, regulatory protein of adaptative response / DNA-3-methyladenine glycosylase II